MGSTLRVNDTLQITSEQGFPEVLDIAEHLRSPLAVTRFEGVIFDFCAKEGIRNFQQPPTANFLVQNYQGTHIYWGLIFMLWVTHDYANDLTSGRYRLHTLYTPEQMRLAPELVGLERHVDYFSSPLYKRPG
jgi:hypothetical protein